MTTGKTITLTLWTFVGKVMSLLYNMLSRFVIAFLPRSKCLLISWLQSPSAVILELKKIKSVTVAIFSASICHEVVGLDAMILVFWMLRWIDVRFCQMLFFICWYDCVFCFFFPSLAYRWEKATAPHSSTLAWKIPWTEELGRLQSLGSLRVGHNWATSLSLFTFMHWRRKWQPTPVFLPGESQGRGSLVGCCLWGCTESDTNEVT